MYHKHQQGAEIPDALLAPELPNRGVETSIQAGQKIRYSAATVKFMVLEALRDTFPLGATSDELSAALKVPYKNVQPRLSDLKDAGFVTPSGRTRPNADGNPVIVWVAL